MPAGDNRNRLINNSNNNNTNTPSFIVIESDEDDDDILLVREEKISDGLEEDDDIIFIAEEEPIMKRKKRSATRDAQSQMNSCHLEKSTSVVSKVSPPPLAAAQSTSNCTDNKSSRSICETEHFLDAHTFSGTLDEPDSCSNFTVLEKALTALNNCEPPTKILKANSSDSSKQWDIVQGSGISVDKSEHHLDNNGNCYCSMYASKTCDSQIHTCCYHSLPRSTMGEGSTECHASGIQQQSQVESVCSETTHLNFLHSKHTASKNKMEMKKDKASTFGLKSARSKSSHVDGQDDQEWWTVAKNTSLGNVKLKLIKVNSSAPLNDRNKMNFVDSDKSEKIHFFESGKSEQINFLESGKSENFEMLETKCKENEKKKEPCILVSDSSASQGNLLVKKDLLCFVCTSVCRNMSKCNRGHFVCGTCLEVQVKNILGGKTKQKHVKCPDNTCDTVFSFDELKQTVPSFVVDVLEEKFDKAYLQYITEWMFTDELLKSRSEFATCESPLSTETSPTPNSFVAEEIQTPQNNISLTARETCPNTETLPKYWLPMEHGNNIMVYEVTPDTEEYSHLVIPFHETLEFPKYDIVRILRIQNLILWRYFALKRSEMVEENNGLDVREQQLFHGTHRTYIEAIARKGFDWRLSGKHGAVYGCGSYFAKDSSYSHGYTDRSGDGVSVRHASHRNVQTFVQSLRHSMTYPVNMQQLLAPQRSLLGFQFPTSIQTSSPSQNFSSSLSSTSMSSIGTKSNFLNLALMRQPIVSATQSFTHGSRYKNQLLSQLLSDDKSDEPQEMTPQHHSVNLSAGTADLGAVFSDNIRPGTHTMFMARVLVGCPARGHSSLKRPPPLDETCPLGKCYDSCVDNLETPKIFVIFDSNQCYPEYLIEYACT